MKPALRKLRRLAIWLLSLLLLLAAAEYASVLWLDHRSTHYVVPGETNGSPAWVDNPLFPLRFALPRAAGLPPPMAAVRNSEDRAYRVAVLTDSTPLGPAEHSADYAYPRQLEALLRARLPDIPVEVLHLTLPGANSHVLREIARDLPLLKPDAVVVVCGNDELTGPCGPCAPAIVTFPATVYTVPPYSVRVFPSSVAESSAALAAVAASKVEKVKRRKVEKKLRPFSIVVPVLMFSKFLIPSTLSTFHPFPSRQGFPNAVP